MANFPTKAKATNPMTAKASEKRSMNVDNTELKKVEPGQFPLERSNFIIMIAAAAAIVIGFLLMLGGSSTEAEFNPDIFSTRRIVIGPTIAFLGFVAMGIGVIYLPRRRKKALQQNKAENSDKEA